MNSTQTLSKNKKKRILSGDFSGGPWLGLQASSVRDTGSIPGQGIKILHAKKKGKWGRKRKSKKGEKGKEKRKEMKKGILTK